MKKVNDIIIQKLLEQCKYIKWKNVKSVDELKKENKNDKYKNR